MQDRQRRFDTVCERRYKERGNFLKKESHTEYKTYTTENGVEINVPAGRGTDIEQQQSYQKFINVLSNIVTKYVAEEKNHK